MAASKTSKTIQASATNTAGSTTNGTEWNASTAYGGLVCGKITNGGTGPTIGCSMNVYVGEATGIKRLFASLTAGVGSGLVTDFVVEIPPGAMFVNVSFTGNTGQSVTVECYGQELTTI